MLQLLLLVDLVSEPLDDLDIKTFFHNEVAFPRCAGEFSPLIYGLENRKIVFNAALIVVFTEGRCSMNDTGTILDGNVIHACHEESFFVGRLLAPGHELFIFPVLHVTAFEFFQDFIFILAENLGSKILCEIEDISFVVSGFHEYLDVIDVRSHCKNCIGNESPGRGGPCQEVFVLSSHFFELAGKSVYLYHLVALSYFVGSKSGAASRAVRQDLVSFIDQILVEGLLHDPPSCLDVVVIESDIWIVHVSHVSHAV